MINLFVYLLIGLSNFYGYPDYVDYPWKKTSNTIKLSIKEFRINKEVSFYNVDYKNFFMYKILEGDCSPSFRDGNCNYKYYLNKLDYNKINDYKILYGNNFIKFLKSLPFFYYSSKHENEHDFFKKLKKEVIRSKETDLFLNNKKEIIAFNHSFYSRYTIFSPIYKYLRSKKIDNINFLKYYLNINKIKIFLLAQSLCPNCNIKYTDIFEFKNKRCMKERCDFITSKIPNYIINVKNFYIVYKNYEEVENYTKIKTTFNLSVSSYTGDILEFLLNIRTLTFSKK